MVHVGAVDAPVSVGDVTQIAAEFKRAVGTGKDAPDDQRRRCAGLGFRLRAERGRQAAGRRGQHPDAVPPHPRDVMDKRAVEQGDIQFFELAALSVEVKTKSATSRSSSPISSSRPTTCRRRPARRSSTGRSGSTTGRSTGTTRATRSTTSGRPTARARTRSLALETTHTYDEPGEYAIVVKVIDILGNDTTKTVKVRVT